MLLSTFVSLARSPHAAPNAPRSTFRRPTALLIALAVVGSGLAGCAPAADQFAPACPQLALLRGAADITLFRPTGQDVTDMVLDGRITAVPASCSRGKPGIVRAQLHAVVDLTRGPAATGRSAVVPYFVAVTDGDRVLDEQDYRLVGTFPANIDRVSLSGEDIELDIPVTADKSAAAYKIYVGFRLSAEELAYNRKRGAR